MRVDLHTWNDFVKNHPDTHILQSGIWGELKANFGWEAVRVINDQCGAQILFRKLPGGFSIGYIPKGPIGYCSSLFSEIDQVCKQERAIFVKVEPDIWEPKEVSFLIHDPAWKVSRPIQPRRTVIISLQGTEEVILGRMKQKTRYNIRLAEKKEIVVQSSNNVDLFHKMSEITGKRDGFGIHAATYYQKIFDLFNPTGAVKLFFACHQEHPVAGLVVFKMGTMAWYMYGASSDEERNRMPTYLLQWEAMKWAKEQGCDFYDLWGIPDMEEEKLEEVFSQKHSHDGLWGVYRFKRGFGGEVYRSAGAWDKVYYPSIYKVYQQMMRLRGRQEE